LKSIASAGYGERHRSLKNERNIKRVAMRERERDIGFDVTSGLRLPLGHLV